MFLNRKNIVVDNGEDSAEGMDQYLREGASGSLAETFGGYVCAGVDAACGC